MQQRKLRFGFFPTVVSTKECTDTAMAMTLICLLAMACMHSLSPLPAALILLLLGMVWPRLYTPLAKLWIGLSLLLGSVMSRVLLTVIFFVVVTPLAVIMRFFGHDPMGRKGWKKSAESTFVTRDHLFEPKDIEHPF
jgi:hypothetical protein